MYVSLLAILFAVTFFNSVYSPFEYMRALKGDEQLPAILGEIATNPIEWKDDKPHLVRSRDGVDLAYLFPSALRSESLVGSSIWHCTH